MRSKSSIHKLIAAAGIATLAGCSGGTHSGMVPAPTSLQARSLPAKAIAPGLFNVEGVIRSTVIGRSHLSSYDACPATGPIKYVSDQNNDVIYIYTGKFAGQAPCGQIAAAMIPEGLYVKNSTHDLYVANGDGNILVFHRGQTSPYNTFTEPTDQSPQDVTVGRDGTVIASNFGGPGSLSTWIGGPNGGTYVGNFQMKNSLVGGSVTVNKKGIVYYDDNDRFDGGAVWSVSCPAGACGVETQVPASQQFAFGLAFDSTGDLLLNDAISGTADTFELPNHTPTTFPLGSYPCALAINRLDHHWFVADPVDQTAAEYAYPSGGLIGMIRYDPSAGVGNGIAVDP